MTTIKKFISEIIIITKKPKLFILLSLIIFSVLGSLYMLYIWNISMDTIKEQVLNLAETVEASFQKEIINNLEALPEDINKPEYKQIKNSLIKIATLNNNISFAYIYTQRNGKIYIIADSKPVDSKDYSPPGQEYTEADKIYFKPFTEDKSIITNIITDRWGKWVSILVPIKEPGSEKIMAVLGMDYPSSSWNYHAVIRIIQAGFVFVCLFLICMAFYNIFLKNIIIREEKNKILMANEKLIEKEELFRAVFEQSPVGIGFGNSKGEIIDINPMFEKITGRSKEELVVLNWKGITHPDDLENDLINFNEFQSGETSGYSMKKRYIKPDGIAVWVNITIAPLNINNKFNLNHICIAEDISENIRAEEHLRESERSKAMLLFNLPGMAYSCKFDKNWTMQFVSEGCYELTGYKPESLLNNNEISYNEIINPEYRELIWEIWTQKLKQRIVFKEEYSITTSTGEKKWVFEQGCGVYDDKGNIKAIEGLIIDISDQKKREDEIIYLNYHDALTGIYNRRFFEDEKKRVNNEKFLPLSVIVGDIDGLKLINNALGHPEGDKLLIKAANILKSCCREDDILARTGGDEFTVIMPNTSNENANKLIKIVGRICEGYKRKNNEDTYHVSI
ncbi:MAG: domain S-box, partial [Clostridia bacterium]|nr:domain S-box [Clostridia bacterium]